MRLGTRGSRLAMAQSNIVIKLMKEHFPEEAVELKIISTTGDRVHDKPLASLGGFGAFVKELDNKILSNEIDIAVNSLKDMPVMPTEGTELAAVLPRGPVEDILVSPVPLSALPAGSVVGTSSVRRRYMLMNMRPDLTVKDLRGNVPTRLGKVKGGEYDAIVLARAGVERLNIKCDYFPLDPERFIPAVGQGAIAIVCAKDSPYKGMLSKFNHEETRLCVDAERRIMKALGGGCSVPIGIWATTEGNALHIRGTVVDSTGISSFSMDRMVPLDKLDEGLDAYSRDLKTGWEMIE